MAHTARRETVEKWRAAILLTTAFTLVRLIALFSSPLELYPDEAQYWLWSRALDLGYFSKPPMIAWAIWASTAVGGNAEPWVRLPAVLFQAAATLTVFALGRRLYGLGVGLAGAAIYALMPGIQLSALAAATDAPLMCFLGLTLLAYTHLQETRGTRRIWVAACLGAALGLAFLSKYAALYFLVGLALHLALSRSARAAWTFAATAAASAVFALMAVPNVVWNLSHGLATMRHTAANASWGGWALFNPSELGDFLISQFAVFGPIPMAALVVGTVLAVRRRTLAPPDLLLLCFTLPPLLIVAVQAFISQANANWAGASYLAAAVLVAAWLVRWRTKRWFMAALAIQSLAAVAFLALVISPPLAEKIGAANVFKRAMGWRQASELVLERAAREADLSAIAVNDRFLFYAISYYARGALAGPEVPPLRAWLLTETPQNHAEASAPLTPLLGGRVLAVAYEGWRRDEMSADFTQTSGLEIVRIRLDPVNRRRMDLFVGQDFQPRPRDPLSGPPKPL